MGSSSASIPAPSSPSPDLDHMLPATMRLHNGPLHGPDARPRKSKTQLSPVLPPLPDLRRCKSTPGPDFFDASELCSGLAATDGILGGPRDPFVQDILWNHLGFIPYDPGLDLDALYKPRVSISPSALPPFPPSVAASGTPSSWKTRVPSAGAGLASVPSGVPSQHAFRPSLRNSARHITDPSRLFSSLPRPAGPATTSPQLLRSCITVVRVPRPRTSSLLPL